MARRAVVCIPTYCEASNIEVVLSRTRQVLADLDILVVDDDSPDGTADIARRVGAQLGGVVVLGGAGKHGIGTAYRRAYAWSLGAGFEVICQMDADLSHDPEYLPGFLASIESGADVVVGSRYVPGGAIPDWSIYRRALSRAGNRYAAVALGLPQTDLTSGFRAMTSDAARLIDVSSTRASGYGFQIECVYRAQRRGLRVREVPIVFRDRVHGRSKLGFRVALEELSLVTGWGVRDRLARWGRSDPAGPE